MMIKRFRLHGGTMALVADKEGGTLEAHINDTDLDSVAYLTFKSPVQALNVARHIEAWARQQRATDEAGS